MGIDERCYGYEPATTQLNGLRKLMRTYYNAWQAAEKDVSRLQVENAELKWMLEGLRK